MILLFWTWVQKMMWWHFSCYSRMFITWAYCVTSFIFYVTFIQNLWHWFNNLNLSTIYLYLMWYQNKVQLFLTPKRRSSALNRKFCRNFRIRREMNCITFCSDLQSRNIKQAFFGVFQYQSGQTYLASNIRMAQSI